MISQSIRNGVSLESPVRAGESLLLSPVSGSYSAWVVAGIASLPVALALDATTGGTYGPWSNDVVVRIKAGAVAVIDYDIDTAPSIDSGPVTGAVVTQAVRTSNFTIVPSDSGTIIPVTGTVTVTLNASSDLTAPVEIRRDNAGTLGVTQTGVTAINPATGSAWGALQVANKLAAIIISPGSTADEYSASKVGA